MWNTCPPEDMDRPIPQSVTFPNQIHFQSIKWDSLDVFRQVLIQCNRRVLTLKDFLRRALGLVMAETLLFVPLYPIDRNHN